MRRSIKLCVTRDFPVRRSISTIFEICLELNGSFSANTVRSKPRSLVMCSGTEQPLRPTGTCFFGDQLTVLECFSLQKAKRSHFGIKTGTKKKKNVFTKRNVRRKIDWTWNFLFCCKSAFFFSPAFCTPLKRKSSETNVFNFRL